MTCLAIKLSEAVSSSSAGSRSTARELGCFCGQILIKGLDVVFLKAASPQTVQRNVLDSRFEVCSEVLCCYSVSQSDCHTEHAILLLAVAWH